MPIYEYVCESCGKLTEVMQKVSDPPPKKCECGSKKLAKVMSKTSFRLKGGGWYSDLYSTPKQKKEAESGASSSSGESKSKPGPKAEAKPEAKKDAKPAK